MLQTAIIIGTPDTCHRIEQQLDLLDPRPVSIGWVITHGSCSANTLGTLDDLESIVAKRKPHLALISLPGAMSELILSIRTRLRRMNIPDRFMPTLEDQISGVGPRTDIAVDVDQLLGRAPRIMDKSAIRRVVTGRRVLVTGAGGSIGSELARVVSAFQPLQIMLMDRSENALFEIDRQIARLQPGLSRRALLHDVVDHEATRTMFSALKPDLIFHAAAHKHVPMMEDHPAAAVENNFFGTVSVADAAADVGAERCVLISTDKAVNPTSVMGMTKRLAELYVQYRNQDSTGKSFSIVRFGNVLASSGSVLEIWSRQIADGGPLTVTDPAMTRYFMTIPEAASLVIQAAAQDDSGGDVFLLDMGDPVRIVNLVCRFAAMHGLRAILPGETVDTVNEGRAGTISVVYTGIRPGEKLHEDLTFDAEAMRPTAHPDINMWCLAPPKRRYIDEIRDTLLGCRDISPTELTTRIRRLVTMAELEAVMDLTAPAGG